MPKKRKTAVVSGGMGGVGRAVCAQLAAEGFDVVALYFHTTEKEAESFVKTLYSGAHRSVRCDICDAEAVARAIEEVRILYGAIDVCVHSAVGALARTPVLAMSAEGFKEQFEAGFFGAFNLFSSVAPHMKERRRGALIGITTSAIEEGGGGARMGAYTVAKHALRALLRELHKELSREGIGVYAIAPDLLKTPLNADLPEKYFEFAREKSLRKKLMTPKDVAQAVLRAVSGAVPPGSSLLVSSGAF